MAAIIGTCRKCFLPIWKRPNECLQSAFVTKRSIFISLPTLAGGKFRKSQGQAADSLAYGPLTDLPDWSYLDGSLPPLSSRQINRQKKRIETATRIVTLLKEINEAKDKSVAKSSTESAQEENIS